MQLIGESLHDGEVSVAAKGMIGFFIMTGVSRGAFSNEAGIGTEALAHGAAKTDEPVREGLVAMMGPAIDTLLVCTCTALVILVTGLLDPVAGMKGVSLTAAAFDSDLPGGWGSVLLLIMVFFPNRQWPCVRDVCRHGDSDHALDPAAGTAGQPGCECLL